MKEIKKILVIWWWTSGYLTVYYLLKKFSNINIEWVFPEENNAIWVWEATIPFVQSFLSDLWIDLDTIINKCNWTVKLWLEFEWFYEKNTSYYHPFFSDFKDGIKITSLMLNNLIDSDLLLNKKNYAVHFDVVELTKFLDLEITKYKNIKIFREVAWEIKKDEYNYIENIWNYKADLYIDCTWFSRKIINSVVVEENFLDITDVIPNNTALVYRSEYTDKANQLKNYTKCKAMNYWWCWNIPLKDKLSVWYVHDNNYDVHDEYVKYLTELFWKIDESKIMEIKMKTWRNHKHISNNVIAIWLSSCFIEPLESTWLYFVVKNIISLWSYIKWDIDEKIFNDTINNEFDSVLSFILAHYKYTNNSNEYWDFYKNIDISVYKESPLFEKDSWYMILKWMWKPDYIREYLGDNLYKVYTIVEKTFKYSEYLKNKVNYIKWLESKNYSNWVNEKL